MALDSVLISPLTAGNYRAIGPEASGGPSGDRVFQADITEREEHQDELMITEHPVETTSGVGAVSDHAYRRPSELHIRIGWNNAGRDQNYIQGIYADLLKLQRDRYPMDVYTGKRPYSNMLIAGISTESSDPTEYSLLIDVHFREVLLVNTQSASITSDSSAQADPSISQPNKDVGAVQTTDAGSPGGGITADLAPDTGQVDIGTITDTPGPASNPPSNTGADISSPDTSNPQIIPMDSADNRAVSQSTIDILSTRPE